MPKRGLPQAARMRHDSHYVEALAASSGAPVGRMVPIAQLDPNPDQPRQAMGDLSELIASISEKGIIEPLIVRQRRGRFQIIAGERRYQAAVQVDIEEVPVIIREVDESEVIEIALIENIQRKELTPFEEATAIQVLAEEGGCTHEELARRLGKSRTSITESLSLNSIPNDVKRLCGLANISSKSLLLEVTRQSAPAKMIAFIEQITRGGGPTREKARQLAALKKKSKVGRSRGFVFAYTSPNKTFNVRLAFRKAQVARSELIEALETMLSELRSR